MGEEQPADRDRTVGQRLFHGCCGAILGALTVGLSVWFDVPWWVVGLCAAIGFLMAWLWGEEAIEFLSSLWWWS